MNPELDLAAEELAVVLATAAPDVAALFQRLLARLAAQDATIAQQAATIATLTARVRELEDQLHRTSHNSHQPPSADGFKKQPRSLRSRSGKRPGGQPGHPGHILARTDQPDQVVRHRPTHWAHCGADLAGQPAQTSERRQVVDLPPLRLLTTEHQGETVACPHCQHPTPPPFPPEAAEPVQYGPQLSALVVYLRSYQLLPSARTQELLADLFGRAPSEATLKQMLTRAATTLTPVVAEIRTALQQAPVVHFDETGCYVEDKRWWWPVACTAELTYYHVDPKRGRAGSAAAGVLPAFAGVAVHDAYASYWEYDYAHALCGAGSSRPRRGTCWTGWRAGRRKCCASCGTYGCRSTTTRRNEICGC